MIRKIGFVLFIFVGILFFLNPYLFLTIFYSGRGIKATVLESLSPAPKYKVLFEAAYIPALSFSQNSPYAVFIYKTKEGKWDYKKSGNFKTMLLNTEKETTSVLSEDNAPFIENFFSPDGSKVIYQKMRAGSKSVSDGQLWEGVQDGKRETHLRFTEMPTYDLYVYDLKTGSSTKISNEKYVSNNTAGWVDNHTVKYVCDDYSVKYDTGGRVCVVDILNKNVKVVVLNDSYSKRVDYSSDIYSMPKLFLKDIHRDLQQSNFSPDYSKMYYFTKCIVDGYDSACYLNFVRLLTKDGDYLLFNTTGLRNYLKFYWSYDNNLLVTVRSGAENPLFPRGIIKVYPSTDTHKGILSMYLKGAKDKKTLLQENAKGVSGDFLGDKFVYEYFPSPNSRYAVLNYYNTATTTVLGALPVGNKKSAVINLDTKEIRVLSSKNPQGNSLFHIREMNKISKKEATNQGNNFFSPDGTKLVYQIGKDYEPIKYMGTDDEEKKYYTFDIYVYDLKTGSSTNAGITVPQKQGSIDAVGQVAWVDNDTVVYYCSYEEYKSGTYDGLCYVNLKKKSVGIDLGGGVGYGCSYSNCFSSADGFKIPEYYSNFPTSYDTNHNLKEYRVLPPELRNNK